MPERPRELLTICLRYDSDTVDLMMKKRGFGAGRWNGYGGKVLDGETPERCGEREITEECGCAPSGLEQVAILEFVFEGKQEILETHVFRIRGFEGEPQESEEMGPPTRFRHGDVPYGPAMWPADRYWMPLVFESKKLKCRFYYGDHSTIYADRNEMAVVDSF